MTEVNSIWARLRYGVTNYDEEIVLKAAEEVIELGLDAGEAIAKGLLPGIEEVGNLYERQEYSVAQMMMSADALYRGLNILRPHFKKLEAGPNGQVLIGVIQGDVHDIGKNIVKMMFDAAGFEVHDLGYDVSLEKFLNEQLKTKPDIIALSAMMTTTMVDMKKFIQKIKERDKRVKVLVGGAPINEVLAEEAGADGYAKDANNALKEAFKMVTYLRKSLNCMCQKNQFTVSKRFF